MRNILCCLLLLAFGASHAQEITFGDKDLMSAIQASSFKSYETRDTMVFLLTKTPFFDDATGGTNLVVNCRKKEIVRIVAFTTTNSGLFSCEFYYEEGKLVMIYETLEYYEEAGPKGQVRNFKGLQYWESRLYYDNNKLVAHKHSGRNGIGKDFDSRNEIRSSQVILGYVKERAGLK